MDKNKKTLLKFYLVVSTPLILTLVLLAEKLTIVPRLPVWAVLLPVIIPVALLLLVGLSAWYMAWRYRRLHGRKCCGNCIHCLDDVYLHGKSSCLRDGHTIPIPRRHSCKLFYGSVLKNYNGSILSGNDGEQ